ncbi:MAG: YfhO family protein, partial [Candidatus Levybacteria bacterium]|nr:YfhO family protein [Candidatus Levybacteria bacterium]
MKLVRKYKIIFVFCVILICTLFWPFFLKNLYPFPGNYLLAWYQPWKTDHLQDKTITIQHKPVADDTFRYIYPFKKLGIDIAKRGQFPLWNPYNGAGMPLLATYQWAFLNPFNVLFLFLQMETAWTIYIIIQAFLLTFFTYLYCRKIGISLKGSIFATSIFTLSGFVVARLIFSNLIYPLTMLPLILYLIEDYIKNAKSKNILILPLAISFTFFSGHPHTAIYTLIVATAYFLYRNILTKNFNRKLTHNFLLVGMLFLIGVGLAGIQLIPTIELLKNSNMNADSSAFIFDRFLLPISHLISILIPNYFGNQATYNYWGAGDYIETVVAVGLIPSFFAYLSIFNRNS